MPPIAKKPSRSAKKMAVAHATIQKKKIYKLPGATAGGTVKVYKGKDDKVKFDLFQPTYQKDMFGHKKGEETPNKYLDVLCSFADKDEFLEKVAAWARTSTTSGTTPASIS